MPRPPRYAKGLAKREEILTTALDVIARSGYRGTPVRELANAVGLSQAGLLHYFSSKEELFTEILAKRDADNEEAFDQRGESPVDGWCRQHATTPTPPALCSCTPSSRWRPVGPGTRRTTGSSNATPASGNWSPPT